MRFVIHLIKKLSYTNNDIGPLHKPAHAPSGSPVRCFIVGEQPKRPYVPFYPG